MQTRWLSLVVALALAGMASSAAAQPTTAQPVQPAPAPPAPAQTAIYDFSGDTIEGDLQRPTGGPLAPLVHGRGMLARAVRLDHAGRTEDAARLYHQIIDRHPRSRDVPAALLALGEQAFARGDAADALAQYEHALAARPTPAVREYARYKLGWILLDLSRSEDAFASFAAVAAAAGRDVDSIARAARDDLPRAYAGFGTAADAYAAFEHAVPGHGLELVGRLAGIWLDEAKAMEALDAFHDVLARAPDDPRACEWQTGATRAAALLDEAARLTETTRLVDTLVRSNARGGVAGDVVVACEAAVTELTFVHGSDLDSDSAITQNQATIETADRYYALHLRAFPASPVTRLGRAELARRLAELAPPARQTTAWQRAADLYRDALDAGGLDAVHVRAATDARASAARRAAGEPPAAREAGK